MAFLAVLMLLQSAALIPADAATIDDAGMITVTASRLDDLAAAAAACEKQGCPTRKDIAVTVAYASALFDDGKYLDAKRLLAGAVGRNKAAARAEPLALSTLYQAQATLASHEGDQDVVREATWASAVTLREALPGDALPVLTAELRLADWQLRAADKTGAEARFADIAARATAGGQREIADVALLRRALTLNAMKRRSEAAAVLEAVAARADGVEVRRVALATGARLASDAGDRRRADRLAARLAAEAPGPEPLLLSSAPLPNTGVLLPKSLDVVGIDRGAQGADIAGLRWVDIGYRIMPGGEVEDVRVLRGSARLDWARPLIGYVGSRRYSAFAADKAGIYRVERYTLTADYGIPKGSLVRRRVFNPRFEVMAMTVPAEVAAAN